MGALWAANLAVWHCVTFSTILMSNVNKVTDKENHELNFAAKISKLISALLVHNITMTKNL
jgi:hypothetical protein